MTVTVASDAATTIRHFQRLQSPALGYQLPLPLGDFKVGLITTGGENAKTCAVRVRDVHGLERDFVINQNKIKIVMPSNDASQATVEQVTEESEE